MAIDEIPVSCAYFGPRCGPLEATPPLLSLALENIKHYQLVSDNDNVLHLTCVPIYVRIGYMSSSDDDTVSPSVGIDLPIGGDAKYVEPAGSGLIAMEKRIEKSEYRMAMLGLSMLMSDSRAAETATSKRIDKAESDSALATHARNAQDAFEEALRLTAKWLDLELPAKEKPGAWIGLNRNFEDLTIDPQMAGVLANMVVNKKLTQETLWEILKRGRVLPDTFDPEDEAEKLEEQSLEDAKKMAEMMSSVNPSSGAQIGKGEDDVEE